MSQNTGRTLEKNERFRFQWNQWTIVFLTAGLFALLSLTRPAFLTFNNIHSIVYGVTFNFFASIGFTLLIIMGELDMSVGSLYGFGGAMMGLFIFQFKMPTAPAILLAVLIAALIGLVTGYLVTKFRLNSMMVTIGVMMAVKGLNWIMVNQFSGRQFSLDNYSFIKGQLFGVNWTIYAMLVVAVVFEVLLIKSRQFRQLYAIGDNPETAKLYGLNADAVKCLCFSASAALSAFGGTLMTARLKHPDVTVGSGLEITIITAAVVGGASIFGGRGSVVRTMLGVFFIFMLQSGMTAFGINSYIQQIVLGAILVAAIYLDLRINGKQH